jgi:hypothetical protein
MQSIHVRKALVLVMASSGAEFRLTNATDTIVYQDSLSTTTVQLPDVPNGGRQEFNFYFADKATPNQTMPLGTTVDISISDGELKGQTSFTVSNNNNEGYTGMNFFVAQETGSAAADAFLTFTITSPSGLITSLSREINLL